jgi:hypothetical protein
MNCIDVRKQIAGSLSDSRTPKGDDPIMRHIATCELCRHFYEDVLLGHAIANMPTPEPVEGFSGKAISNAVRHNRAKRRKTFISMSAAAAIIVFGVVLTWNTTEFPGFKGTEMQSAAVMGVEAEKTIRLMIETSQDRRDATLTIELAENLTLKSHPSEARVEWQTDLVKGKNLLELPLLLKDEADGYINVRYRYNGTEKEVYIHIPGETRRT